MKCGNCGDDVPMLHTLNHVSFDKEPVSWAVSEMEVCPDCRREMEQDDDISWS